MESQTLLRKPKITSQHSSSHYCKERSETCQLNLLLEGYNPCCVDCSRTGKNTWKMLRDRQAPLWASRSFFLHKATELQPGICTGKAPIPSQWMSSSSKLGDFWMNSDVILKKAFLSVWGVQGRTSDSAGLLMPSLSQFSVSCWEEDSVRRSSLWVPQWEMFTIFSLFHLSPFLSTIFVAMQKTVF